MSLMSAIKINADLDSVCRICLEDNEQDMTSIYHRVSGDKLMVYEKIERCCGFKLINDPDLPTHICSKCNVFLTVAHKFRIICRRSNNYLRDYVCKTAQDNLFDQSLFEEEEAALDECMLDQDHCDTIDADNEYDIELTPNPIDNAPNTYTEQWLNDNINLKSTNALDQAISKDEQEEINGPQIAVEKLPANTASENSKGKPKHKKTLDMSADGTAVIRVNRSVTPRKKEPAEKQLHICDICGNTYPRKYALGAHMRRHRDEKPFECEICHMSFHLNFQLTRHIRKHTGVRPYTCKYCQRSFSDRSTMVKHERIHTNERPYYCEQCGKSFSYSSVLKVHRLTHTGEKPYSCNICDKRFARGHHLRAHLETLLHQKDPRAAQQLKALRRIDNE